MRSWPLVLLVAACAGSKDPVDTAPDTDTDVVAIPQISTVAPFLAPVDPLAAASVAPCAVIDATRCDNGVALTCAPYDPTTETFTDAPELLARAWHFDRWYDLYHSPSGQTSDRTTAEGFAPGTPEATFGDPARFSNWDGFGDSAIWTGVATNAAMMRWLATGTEADRVRFEDKVRTVLTQFEVTDAVGYLARAHFLALPDGSATSPDHLTLTESQADDTIRFVARDPSTAPDLPADYGTGVTLTNGEVVGGTVMWQGNPSIDQYTGAMTVLPAAWSLLEDQDLKDRIEAQLVGYLHRLERIELRNLQANPEFALAAANLLGAGVTADDDLNIDDLDTLVAYALPAYSHRNETDFPRDAPVDFPRGAAQVYDAGSPTFLIDLLALMSRLSAGGADSLDHIYAPSVRGGDAVHMMHLATMALHMTGEERYRDFLQDDLIDSIGADRVANTLAALVLPTWCRSFYGDHITVPPLWALLNLLEDGPLKVELERAMLEEGWDKLSHDLGNAKFNLMIADYLDAGPLKEELRTEAMSLLAGLGGNGGILDDPRRTYTLSLDDLQDGLGDALVLQCPTETERAQCEDGFNVLGIELPGEDISETCTGTELDCDLGDGRCAWAISSAALPLSWRSWEDFAWQRNPFELGAAYGTDGTKSSPGLDLTESYWLARAQGVETEGDELVLAWRDDGSLCK
jgi:hypothetical protein